MQHFDDFDTRVQVEELPGFAAFEMAEAYAPEPEREDPADAYLDSQAA